MSNEASSSAQAHEEDEIVECSICLGENHDALRILYCGHIFHEICIEGWKTISVAKLCPECNKNIDYLRDHTCTLCNNKFSDDGEPFVRLKCHNDHIYHASCLLTHSKAAQNIKNCTCPAQGCSKTYNMFRYPILAALHKKEILEQEKAQLEAAKAALLARLQTLDAQSDRTAPAITAHAGGSTIALGKIPTMAPYNLKSASIDASFGATWGFLAHQILEDSRMTSQQKMSALALLVASLGGVSATLDRFTPQRRLHAYTSLATLIAGIAAGYKISQYTTHPNHPNRS